MRYFSLSIILSVLFLFSGCGEKKTEVKPEKPVEKKEAEVKKSEPVEDTSFNTVMRVLKEALDNEKTASDSAAKLKTAKAYILVIKFLNTDKEKVKQAGMTDRDISELKKDAKENATVRLNEILSSQTAPKAIKDEAQAKLNELKAL
ncbi:MAG: hypothetical protein N2258_07145 [Brevinematales bacterium]|nr:hypothetical protein [Brevinematales bacterium]